MSVNVVNKTTGALTKVAGNAITEASGINYSHTTSGMSATNVQDAIDESYSSLKSGLTNLDNEVNGDATVYPYADVITIEDAVPANLADCSVKIEPVQDLHGYGKPWVGGAGKNLLPLTVDEIKAANTSGTWDGNAYTLLGVTYTLYTDDGNNVTGIKVNGTSTGGQSIFNITKRTLYTLPAGNYKLGLPSNDYNSNIRIRSYGDAWSAMTTTPLTLSYSSDQPLSMDIAISENSSVNNVMFYPILTKEEDYDGNFYPYTNICPITQYDSCKITRAGKNLFDVSTVELHKSINDVGFIYPTENYNLSDYIRVSGTKLIVSGDNKDKKISFGFYDKNKIWFDFASSVSVNTAVTIPNGTAYVRFDVYKDSENIQLELGQTATPYEPYKCNYYQIELNGNTYYGKIRIDTQGNVYFDVDRGYGTFTSSDTWEFGIAVANKYDIFRLSSSIAKNSSSIKSDSFEGVEIFGYKNYQMYVTDAGRPAISVPINEYNTTTLHNLVDNTNFVYELANPFTIVLKDTPINLVKGLNTIYADTGDVEVTVNNTMDAIGSIQEQVNDHEERIEDVKSGLIGVSDRSRSNITTKLADLPTAVLEQNLEKYGYKIGDYFVGASGYTYILADMDTYYGGYNNNAIVNTHHISLVVKTGATSKWAETNDTSGGYKTSTLHSYLSSTVLDNIKSDMIALFGGSTGLEHLVSHKLLWTTATSAWEWSDNAEYISALSEPQVYGTNVWAIDGYQTGEAWKWLEVFHKFNFCEILGNIWWWLRSISSDSLACYASSYGFAYYRSASDSIGAVGLIIFH